MITIRNTYKDIFKGVLSLNDDILILIVNAMDDDFETVLNDAKVYSETSSHNMVKLIREGCNFNDGEKFMHKWKHTDILDADCETGDDIFDWYGKREIANFIDDNNGFKDLIYLIGNRFELDVDDEAFTI